MGLPSTYQQVLKNMKQIAEDHELLTDSTIGLEAIANKVNDSTTGLDAVNTKLDTTADTLDTIADKVNDPDTGLDAAVAMATEAKETSDELKDHVDVIDKYIDLPDNVKVDPETGKLIYVDDEGNPIVDPDTGEPKEAETPNITYDELAKIVEQLQEMFIKVPEPGEEQKSSVVVNSDGETKVTGIHVNTSDPSVNSTPDSYKHGVTYEIKNIGSIGLSGKTGMTGTYCLVATFTKDSALDSETSSISSFKPFQIAYGTSSGTYYKRFADSVSSTSWGEWMSGSRTMLEMAVVQSTEPASGTQLTGEFWYETLA